MRRAEPIAGLGGVLLLVSLFLPWYDVATVGRADPRVGTTSEPPARAITAWQAFAVIDVLLAALALLAHRRAARVAARTRGPAEVGRHGGHRQRVSAWIAVAARRVPARSTPADELDSALGAWLGLAGALIAWVGSWLSLRDESTPARRAPDIPRRPAPTGP